jgi:hypothetical protein
MRYPNLKHPTIIETAGRQPLVVTPRGDGWMLQSGRTYLLLSDAEVAQFVAHVESTSNDD